MRFRSMRIPVSIRASYNMADIKALVDSGATDNFIHPNFVKRMGLGQRELDKPKNIYIIDDTTNKAGQITHYLSLAVTTAGKTQEMRFLVTDIGREDVLLGYPWLSTYEPHFSWRHGTIDESNLLIVLHTINPNNRKDVVLRYLSTDKCTEIVAELEQEVGGELPTIRDVNEFYSRVRVPIGNLRMETCTRLVLVTTGTRFGHEYPEISERTPVLDSYSSHGYPFQTRVPVYEYKYKYPSQTSASTRLKRVLLV
jgi:hypothetical protein